jgi:eukaryotic-like serine/threonine-protein kinase
MAPEQVLGRAVTSQADIYSFGVLLYEMLTGQKPITELTVEKIFQQVIYQPLPMEPLVKAHVPGPVSDLIVRATAKQATQRPPNLGVVCDELERFLGQSFPAAPYKPAPAVQPARLISKVPAPVPSVPVPPKTPSAPLSPAALMAIAFGGMLLLVLLLYAILVRFRLL